MLHARLSDVRCTLPDALHDRSRVEYLPCCYLHCRLAVSMRLWFPRVRRALPACYVLAAPYLSPARVPLDGTACSADSPRRVQALPLEACTLRPVIAGLPPDAR